MNASDFLIKFFSAKGLLPSDRAALDQFDFLDRGILDSLDIVGLVADLEDQFEIRFSHEQMTSPEFRKVGTLITMVEGMLSAKG